MRWGVKSSLNVKVVCNSSVMRSSGMMVPCFSSRVFSSRIPCNRVLSKIDQLTSLCVAHSLVTSTSISALNLFEKVSLSRLLLSSRVSLVSGFAGVMSVRCVEVAERKLLPRDGWPGDG